MVVSTGTIIEYSANSVKVGGQIIDLGEGAIQYEHCYGTTPGVSIKGSASTNNVEPNKTGDFTSDLKNLEGGITFYVKAYISDGIAIEKARTGHPLVYSWMADYFYNGYGSIYIENGIKILEPYLDDPNCLSN